MRVVWRCVEKLGVAGTHWGHGRQKFAGKIERRGIIKSETIVPKKRVTLRARKLVLTCTGLL